VAGETTRISKTPDFDRRRFCGVAAATAAAGPLGLLGFSRSVNAMTRPVTEGAQKAARDTAEIRPFPKLNVPEAELTELRRRINATRWPERETVTDDSQGVQFATMQKLARYWGSEYDWRKIEAKLNALPQFITEIDGLDIQFIHVRSKHDNALPLIITHGWPGSVIEPTNGKGRLFRRQERRDPGCRERLSGRDLRSPKDWAERAYPKLIHYSKHDKGGHFAAWEQPQLFSEDVRAGFRSLRK
jgi:hypothetical protein